MQHDLITAEVSNSLVTKRRVPAVYLRVSGTGDTSIALQMESLRAFADDHDWTIRDDLVFIDAGIEPHAHGPPALQRLMTLVSGSAPSPFDVLLVASLDRLSAAAGTAATLRSALEAREVEVIPVDTAYADMAEELLGALCGIGLDRVQPRADRRKKNRHGRRR